MVRSLFLSSTLTIRGLELPADLYPAEYPENDDDEKDEKGDPNEDPHPIHGVTSHSSTPQRSFPTLSGDSGAPQRLGRVIVPSADR